MVERVRNVIKTDRKRGKRPLEDETVPFQKRRPKACELLRRYPVSATTIPVVEDASDIDQHENAIKEEMKKKKPRDTVLLPLMKSTYHRRRMFVLNEAVSVSAILEKYPVLSHQTVVSFFFKLVVRDD